MFWENFQSLCQEKGISANKVAKELSIASGTITEWKKGRMPMNATLKKVADYFNVSVSYLTNEQKEKPTPEGELLEDLIVFHRNGQKIEYHLTEEQLKAIKPLLDQLNSQQNPNI